MMNFTTVDTKWLKGYCMLDAGRSVKVLGQIMRAWKTFLEKAATYYTHLLFPPPPPTMSSTPYQNTVVSLKYVVFTFLDKVFM